MQSFPEMFGRYQSSFQVGFFLGVRDLRRSSKWTTILIVFIMSITFLNLIVVRGILIGLIDGANTANKARYSGDIIITTPSNKTRIENSSDVLKTLENIDQIKVFSARYTVSGVVESGYQTRVRDDEETDSVGLIVSGIDVAREEAVTGLSEVVVEGEPLVPGEIDAILMGTNNLAQYQAPQSLGSPVLDTTKVGSRVRLTVNGNTREVLVKGFVKSKVGQIDQRVFMNAEQLRQMMGRDEYDVNEIAVLLKREKSPDIVKNILLANEVGDTAVVQTFSEGRPQFVKDIEDTFNILGNVIGSIGLAAAVISIFIVIFVNAITRRKYIGILKGIGVTDEAIELSYIFQSLFYATCGIVVATVLIVFAIKPYFVQNPLDFPFSDGTIVADPADIVVRAVLLLAATVIAGYIPARIVVKQPTLDAILGR